MIMQMYLYVGLPRLKGLKGLGFRLQFFKGAVKSGQFL